MLKNTVLSATGVKPSGMKMSEKYWNIKLYDGREERETIRGITKGRKIELMRIFDRLHVYAQAMQYNKDGSKMLDSETVNDPYE